MDRTNTDYVRPHSGGYTVDTLAADHSYDELLDALVAWKLAAVANENLPYAAESVREFASDALADAEDNVRELLTRPLTRDQLRTLSNQARCHLNTQIHPSGDQKHFPAATKRAWAENFARHARGPAS